MPILRATGVVERREDREVTSKRDGKQYTFHECVIVTNEFVRNRVTIAKALAADFQDGQVVDVIVNVENGDQYGPRLNVTGYWPKDESSAVSSPTPLRHAAAG